MKNKVIQNDHILMEAYHLAGRLAYNYTKHVEMARDIKQDFAIKIFSDPEKYRASLVYNSQVSFLTVRSLVYDIWKKELRKINYLSANSVPDIAIDNSFDLQLDRSIITKVVDRAVKTHVSKHTGLSVKKQKLILDLATSGKITMAKLAKKYSVSTATINRLKVNGIRQPEKSKTLQYVELFRKGFSAMEIAEKFGVSRQTVTQQIYKVNKKLSNQL